MQSNASLQRTSTSVQVAHWLKPAAYMTSVTGTVIQLNHVNNSHGRLSIYDILADLSPHPACHSSSLFSPTDIFTSC